VHVTYATPTSRTCSDEEATCWTIIATVIQQVRTAGGAEKLSSAIDDWQEKLTARGVAMLHAATQLSSYLRLG
jgi:hypothetical protein